MTTRTRTTPAISTPPSWPPCKAAPSGDHQVRRPRVGSTRVRGALGPIVAAARGEGMGTLALPAWLRDPTHGPLRYGHVSRMFLRMSTGPRTHGKMNRGELVGISLVFTSSHQFPSSLLAPGHQWPGQQHGGGLPAINGRGTARRRTRRTREVIGGIRYHTKSFLPLQSRGQDRTR